MNNMTNLVLINITKAAYEYIHEIIKKNQNNIIGININIKKSGCAGFRYTFNFIRENEKPNTTIKNISFKHKNIIFSIPKTIIHVVKNATLDLEQKGLNKNLKLFNPNIKTTCGCGESFEIK
ncbi:HesB/IscA family protein [Buchnera aphidicola]|uniref:HesB/IscA family protein n=1 Tax=Buchnera aphidicola TaxID=9 RepID=UPI0034639E4A